MKIISLQTNPITGNISSNAKNIITQYKKAIKQNPNLIITSEMSLTGYNLGDLPTCNYFVQNCHQEIIKIAEQVQDIPLIIGSPINNQGKVHNALVLIKNQTPQVITHKSNLNNFNPINETQIYTPNVFNDIITINDQKITFIIGDDIQDETIISNLKKQNVDLICNLTASPFGIKNHSTTLENIQTIAKKYQIPIIFTTCWGGQDELVFDAQSFSVNKTGILTSLAPTFQDSLNAYDYDENKKNLINTTIAPPKTYQNQIWNALVTSTRDYITKNNFKGAVIGLSGGIDSAIVATIATDAIGSENIICVKMPSPFNSNLSNTLADKLANNLNVKLENIPITNIMTSYEQSFDHIFKDTLKDTTEENIQARIRGNILMAISNKKNYLLLTTGNKSESSVGYCTLYGDMAGGFNPIKDLFKTQVFELAHWRNNHTDNNFLSPKIKNLIPQEIISRPPSAELRPDQKDEDSLTPYNKLDKILALIIEYKLSPQEIISQGYPQEDIIKVWHLFHKAEFKRKQSAIGVKISANQDRILPITNHFNYQN